MKSRKRYGVEETVVESAGGPLKEVIEKSHFRHGSPPEVNQHVDAGLKAFYTAEYAWRITSIKYFT